MENTLETIEIGDLVRFFCPKFDDDGWMTDKIIDITGRLTAIEPTCMETSFPKYWVRRKGKDYWYSGDNLKLISKRKRKLKED